MPLEKELPNWSLGLSPRAVPLHESRILMTGERAILPARRWQEKQKPASKVEDIELDAMTFRVVSPLNATGNYPASFIIMVAALSAAVLPLTITS